MTSYPDHTATYLEVRMDVIQPKDLAIRLWVSWGIADAQGKETNTVFGGCLDIDVDYPKEDYHIVVGRWLLNASRQWTSKVGGDNAFIFDAIGSIMEVLGDVES